MPLNALYRTSCPHFMTTTFGIYDITFTIFGISHILYITTHLFCMMSHSLYVVHQTMTLSMISNPICSWHFHFIWHHTQCYDHKPLCAFEATLPDITLRIFLTLKKCTNFMTRSECKSSQPLYVWHHMHYKWHHIHSLWHHATLFMTSSPLYRSSHPLYVT